MKIYSLITCSITSTVILVGTNTFADNAANIFAYASGTAATYDSNPIITAILSQPGTVDGYTYTSWSFLAADSTGSLDIFGLSSSSPYIPTVGDAITVSGTNSPYHQIPEIGSITSISLASSGNAVPAPAVFTIPTLTASTNIPQNIAGQLLELDNVTLYTDSAATTPVSGSFATHVNVTLYAKDGDGNIMEIYDWASSYSTAGAFGGTPFPTGAVNITGFVSQSGSFPVEMTPIAITSVPEPATLGLCGAGALLALAFRSRKTV